MKKDNYVSSDSNSDVDSVASHSCTDGNSIEQLAREVAVDYFCYMSFWENGFVKENGDIDIYPANTHLPIFATLRKATNFVGNEEAGKKTVQFFIKRLAHLLNTEQNVQESDTTDAQ